MRSMIVFMGIAALAKASWIQPVTWNTNWGAHGVAPVPVQDTPEVAAAKVAHFAAVARAGGAVNSYAPAAAWGHNGLPAPVRDTPAYNAAASRSHQYASAYTGHKWTGPIALPPGYDAHGAPLPVLDTPEVAAEKAKHFALVARSGAPVGVNNWAAPYAGAWTGYSNGVPQDTPEVAAAKIAHFAAHYAATGH